MKKLILILILALINLTIVYAADCGGYDLCECGDTLVESHYFYYSLDDCPGHGIIIGADDLTLECYQASFSYIDGDQTTSNYGIYNSGYDNFQLINCTIKEFNRGVLIENAENNIIRNNVIEDSTNSGIRIRYSDEIFIEENLLTNNGLGMTYWGTGGMNILDNEISYNGDQGIGNGWDDENDFSYKTINGNNIHHNTGAGISTGSDNLTVIGNHIHNNGASGLNPIYSVNILVENNIVHDNGYTGINANSIGEGIISGNEVYENDIGILLNEPLLPVQVDNNNWNY
jgi:parallel beta-helix repeat protein